MSQNLTGGEFYIQSALVPCEILIKFGIYLTILEIISVTSNGFLLWIFFKTKELLTPQNISNIALTLMLLLFSLFDLTIMTTSSYSCR